MFLLGIGFGYTYPPSHAFAHRNVRFLFLCSMALNIQVTSFEWNYALWVWANNFLECVWCWTYLALTAELVALSRLSRLLYRLATASACHFTAFAIFNEPTRLLKQILLLKLCSFTMTVPSLINWRRFNTLNESTKLDILIWSWHVPDF